MTAGSEARLCALLKSSGPLGAFSRILLESSRWASTEYLLTWKASATPRGRLRFRLVPSAPRTSGNGSGSWRSPLGTDGEKSGHGNLPYQVKATWPTPNVPNGGRSIAHAEMRGSTAYHKGKKVQVGLEAVAKMSTWPTPKVSDDNQDRQTMASTAREWNREGGSRSSLPLVVKMLATWPTPRAEKHTPQQREDFTPNLPMVAMWTTPQSHDSQGRANPDRLLRHGTKHGCRNLNDEVGLVTDGQTMNGSNARTEKPGALNPEFCSWLMGFPEGWLD